MSDLLVLVEEPSAKIVIDELARRFAPDRNITTVAYEGKQDLQASFPRTISAWRYPEDTHFVVLRDKDSNPDCRRLKADLLELAPIAKRQNVSVRIVMSELEAWYLSDPLALVAGGIVNENIARRMMRQRKFRNPELLNNAKQEFFKLHNFRGQRELARQIGTHLDPVRSTSLSFKLVVSTLCG